MGRTGEVGPGWAWVGPAKKERTGPRPVSQRAAGIGAAAATRLGAAVLAPGRHNDGRNGCGR
ncbi:hypothetical protein CRG98_006468 [Punica granatum]|uniref:Uncharacterized protein n=1 Tax=Punica granatum TaxID=22663 RepID=A0A2I0KZ43_PUNGR|nr:hypothetical protein CRG98_006468 [Punica granatum]